MKTSNSIMILCCFDVRNEKLINKNNNWKCTIMLTLIWIDVFLLFFLVLNHTFIVYRRQSSEARVESNHFSSSQMYLCSWRRTPRIELMKSCKDCILLRMAMRNTIHWMIRCLVVCVRYSLSIVLSWLLLTIMLNLRVCFVNSTSQWIKYSVYSINGLTLKEKSASNRCGY